jgi:DNA (cytosine-5)-methyltransferase 1
MTHGSLFSGIGGFDLAAEWMGWENKFHCEWNTFGQKVLKYYWPNSISYNDITKTDFTIHRGNIDIITGGFPCQPYSSAGKRLGKEDERHLWPEMLRAIREIQPRWVVGENVLGLVNWSGGLVFHEVQTDLEAEGYEVQPYVLPAVSVNAPHRRDRVWFVAYSTRASERANQLSGIRCQNGEISREGSQTIYNAFRSDGIEGITSNTNCNGLNQCNSDNEVNTSEGRVNALGYTNKSNGDGDVANTFSIGRGENEWERNRESNVNDKISTPRTWQNFPTVSPICNGDDGISDRLDSITFSKWRNESIKAGGNAVCPQVVLQIFKTIEQYERINTSDKDK